MLEKIGMGEFRDHLAKYLSSNTPIAVTCQGQTVGYFLPARPEPSEAEAEYLPKVIENDAENEQAINLAEALSHRENRSLEETTLLNLLLTLIEKYEQDHYPLEESEPHSILWELMEANNLQEKDLSDILGSKTIVSDILIGQQIITEKQAVKLGQFFHVDSSLFLSR